MKLRILLLYGMLLVVVSLICAMLWHLQMANGSFVCRHNGIIMDFLPPFVHPGRDGDFFIRPAHVVYTIWGVYVAVAVILPAALLWLGLRVYERDLKKSWM